VRAAREVEGGGRMTMESGRGEKRVKRSEGRKKIRRVPR